MSSIRLVLSDVDGTLLTPKKVLTERALAAIGRLRTAGIAFAVTSSRPPRGLSMLVAPLGLTTPIGAFNGGLLVRPDLSPIEERCLPAQLTGRVLTEILKHGVDGWAYTRSDWLVRRLDAPHVQHEAEVVRFEPKVVSDFETPLEGVVKLVAVSDDPERMDAAEVAIQKAFGAVVSSTRSQAHYLDITQPDANKGTVVKRLSELLHVPVERIATIGDGANDVLMFAPSGLSIAMGNASPEVQRRATHVTARNDDEGFARALEDFVL